MRDGAAGGRRPVLRRARDEGVRRRLGAGPAPRPPHRIPSGLAHGVPTAAERRLGARRVRANRAPGQRRRVRRVVSGAFAHRRKTLANSLALLGVVAAGASRSRRSPPSTDRRDPRGGARAGGVRAAHGGAPGMSDWHTLEAPAKLNLALVVGPRRPDGKHEVVTVLERLSLADTLAVRPAPRDTRDRLRRRHARPRRARRRRERRGRTAALRGAHRQADPGRRGPRRRLERRSRRAPARERAARHAARARRAPRARRSARRRRAVLPRERPQLGTGDGTTLAPLALPRDYVVLLALPDGVDEDVDAQRLRRVRRAPRRGGLSRPSRRAARRARRASRARRPRRDSRRTTSPPRRSRTSSATRGVPRRRDGRRSGRLRAVRDGAGGRSRRRPRWTAVRATWVAKPG